MSDPIEPIEIDINDVPNDWESIASIDESADYETDFTNIYLTPSGYVLLSGSGCSCWSGECTYVEYGSLAELTWALITDATGSPYVPTPPGIHTLLSEAWAALNVRARA